MNISTTRSIAFVLALSMHLTSGANVLGDIKEGVKEKARAAKDTAKSFMPKLEKIAITNKTGKKLKQVKVTFRFEGENNISDSDSYKKGYAEGYVTLKNLENNDELAVYAKDAIRHHVQGKVVDHFSKLTDVKIMRIDIGTISYHDFIHGTHATRFVISSQGRISPYRIETENERNARLMDEDVSAAEERTKAVR